LRGLFVVDFLDFVFMSLSGFFVRSVGMLWDIRLFSCYDLYFLLLWDLCFCFLGDAYDRFLLRLFDMRMSLFLCKQCFFCFFLLFGCFVGFDYFLVDLCIETMICMMYSL